MSRQPVFLIELNELSFELVRGYVDRGELPTFARLFAEHGYATTTSEESYDEWEPWIQWVTAHTGLTLAEHKVFRLGDISATDIVQIWERLESKGLRVGALSPMNAKHRLRNPAFFVPDPWTDTELTGTPLVRRLHRAIVQAVNDNAEARITPSSLLWLTIGLARFARPGNYPLYLRLALEGIQRPWARAALLDLLIGDLFSVLARRGAVDFASLFLNGAAHVQHHYMHSSAVAATGQSNPTWYCPPGQDPLLTIYRVYDRVLENMLTRFRGHRLMIATGLHQVPHPRSVFYWRLKDPRRFLERLEIRPKAVSARMSRDFVVEFDKAEDAAEAAIRLMAIQDSDGEPLFSVDNRGRDLFVTLTYANDIPRDFVCRAGGQPLAGLGETVAFVAIKNGQHDGAGYFLDTGERHPRAQRSFALKTLPERIMRALGLEDELAAASA